MANCNLLRTGSDAFFVEYLSALHGFPAAEALDFQGGCTARHGGFLEQKDNANHACFPPRWLVQTCFLP